MKPFFDLKLSFCDFGDGCAIAMPVMGFVLF